MPKETLNKLIANLNAAHVQVVMIAAHAHAMAAVAGEAMVAAAVMAALLLLLPVLQDQLLIKLQLLLEM